jgi:putative transposase
MLSKKILNFNEKMPSINTITPLLGGSYYHIFNRGVNRNKLFFNDSNYIYFLKLMSKFLCPYVHFLAYCLIPNHFHMAIKLRDEIFYNEKTIKDEIETGKLVTNQFKKLFITYAMAINSQENRVGSLFNPKFRRIGISDQEYLKQLIFYIHYNPEKHKVTNDFSKYKFSSFKALTGDSKTSIDREYVYAIFDEMEGFLNYHQFWHEEKENLMLE